MSAFVLVYFCTSKARKLGTFGDGHRGDCHRHVAPQLYLMLLQHHQHMPHQRSHINRLLHPPPLSSSASSSPSSLTPSCSCPNVLVHHVLEIRQKSGLVRGWGRFLDVEEQELVCNSMRVAARQRLSAYVSARLHTSAYVSIRQHERRGLCATAYASPRMNIFTHTYMHTYIHTYICICIYIHTYIPPTDGRRPRDFDFSTQLDEFYFTTAEKKNSENCRCIVPNFIND